MLCLGLDSGTTKRKGVVLDLDTAFCDGTDHCLGLACTMNVANAAERVRDPFGREMEALETNVARSQPGANGLMFLPYSDGEPLWNVVETNGKTRAEPGKENQGLSAELRGRHADLTQKLASSGYL